MKTFDPTKPVQTRNGCPARIICTDKNKGLPIVALIYHREGEFIVQRTIDGLVIDGEQTPFDLVNVPVKKKKRGWIVITQGVHIPTSRPKATKEEALAEFPYLGEKYPDSYQAIEIEWEE